MTFNPFGFLRAALQAGGRALSYAAMDFSSSAYLFFCSEPTEVYVSITTPPAPPEDEEDDTPPLGDHTYAEWLEQIYNESPSGSTGDETRLG